MIILRDLLLTTGDWTKVSLNSTKNLFFQVLNVDLLFTDLCQF